MKANGKVIPGAWNNIDNILRLGENGTEKMSKARK